MEYWKRRDWGEDARSTGWQRGSWILAICWERPWGVKTFLQPGHVALVAFIEMGEGGINKNKGQSEPLCYQVPQSEGQFLEYKRRVYRYRGSHHHSCHYSFILLLRPTCPLCASGSTSSMTCQTHKCSQMVGCAPLDHTQNILDKNLAQSSLTSMHRSINTQSPSANQNGTESIPPCASLNSEWDKITQWDISLTTMSRKETCQCQHCLHNHRWDPSSSQLKCYQVCMRYG